MTNYISANSNAFIHDSSLIGIEMLLTFVILSFRRSRGIVNDTLRFNVLGLGTCTSQTVRIIERLPELVGDRATLREAAVGAPELHQPK